MFLQRSAFVLARRTAVSPAVRRTFATSVARRAAGQGDPPPGAPDAKLKKFEQIQAEADLLPPGAEVATVPTDLDQATGLERLEILGKMQGIDIFDMKPLDASRKGTLDNPIVVRSFGDEQYAGCTGYPADSHVVVWLTMSRDRPLERCPECGNCLKMEYVGPQDDPHAHHGHGEERKPSIPLFPSFSIQENYAELIWRNDLDADGAHNYVEPKTFADFVRPEYR
ncbi:MAG: Cytochrome c oxidase subunit 4 [Pycnora praestabilis]|nr:MAG: Cytochrome c oxidase subunit 4 [Pycnora praestabilis]